MAIEHIEIEHEVFAGEGEPAFGAVRELHEDHLIVWIENLGDARIDADAVERVHDGKVIVDVAKLSEFVREAIANAHDSES